MWTKIVFFPFYALAILLIYFYKFVLSPFLPNVCRYSPSCSTYAILAFNEYGVFKGFYLSLKRLCRCRGHHSGGVDKLPDNIKGEYKWTI